MDIDKNKSVLDSAGHHQKDTASIAVKLELMKKDELLEQGMNRLKLQNHPGSGSDYDKAGQSSSNVDSGRGSAVYSSGRRPPPEDHHQKGPQGFFVFYLL